MDWILYPTLIWLTVISWFDMRKGEIPNSLWVIVPLIVAGVFRSWQGNGQLVILTVLVVLVSERKRITTWIRLEEAGRIITWLPLLLFVLLWSAQTAPIPALSILGFWIAWEFGWWGGADAVCAIALTLVWPGREYFLALFVSHVVVALGSMVFTCLKEKKVTLHRVPGLPIMLLAVLFSRVLG